MPSEIPILAITMGDPAGIGPEIAAKVFAMGEIFQKCRPLLIGNRVIMQRAVKMISSNLLLHQILQPEEAIYRPGIIDLIELEAEHPEAIPVGIAGTAGGDLAFRAVREAIRLALAGQVSGTVTCPINKEAIHAAGYPFAGHTEIFAHFTRTEKYAMLLADEHLRVIHVSTHVPLRKACDLVKKERIIDTIMLLYDGLKKLGFPSPRIGVAGLNPHAGDNGIFGNEEAEEIIPAILKVRNEGLQVEGPVPPDTLFAMARGGHYDGCVAMYHDQGHIPFKMAGFEWDELNNSMKSIRGVNITLGLPIVRTSVDHGTAFAIAGKGIASPDALLHAVDFAVKLCKYQEI